ncbi:hypothetical protein ElyMa_005543500 [Elysia marginata]|uniref:C2 NT-type domain-containing protein n=1 Tax=Elysia marginata TaxID=1093978 RepID=A0AAV4EXR2_9GAST|nr:hypothetical protein ElyMa_005543500 [Elysia marginata]
MQYTFFESLPQERRTRKLHVTVKWQKLQAVNKSTVLGAVNIDVEVNKRTFKANAAVGKLCENLWERRGLSLTIKLNVYHAVVLNTLPYASET